VFGRGGPQTGMRHQEAGDVAEATDDVTVQLLQLRMPPTAVYLQGAPIKTISLKNSLSQLL